MRWPKLTFLLLPLLIAGATTEWSWGGDSNDKEVDQTSGKPDLLQGEVMPESQELKNADEAVEDLIKRKQGRSLGGFDDDVYSDPTIKEALDAGDDAEARNLIKDRLCTLGLVQCEDGDSQEKRTYVSPDELIYAQPVDIKPIGKPVASIAVRGPPRSYGPPKPMLYPPRPPQKGPPKRVGYGGNTRPGFSDKYGVAGGVASGNFQSNSFSQGSFGGYESSNYVTKPPNFANEGYGYESPKPSYNKVPPSSNPGSKTDSVVQQHVHHHYVHSDAEKEPKVIIKPVAIPVGSIGHLASQGQSLQSSGGVITASGADFSSYGESSGGFKPMTGSISGPVYDPDSVYGSPQYNPNGYNKGGSNNILSQSLPNQYPNAAFEDQKYGNTLGSYSSQNSQFYKKELYVGGESANNLYNKGPATFGQGQGNSFQNGYHEGKAQEFECVCVNYDQCPSQEVIGRRDDLYLPIDPRNKGSEIAALTEEQLDNLNKTDVSVAENNQNSTETETKKVSKREVKEDQETDATKEAEPRLIGLSGFGGNGGDKKVQPTFGVSFGLPQPSHSGYPLNPFDGNPIHNPYGPALNSGGLNLGLVSVNPLLSVQVTKNDYGEKVVKPFVNLHVTPNEHVVNKIGHLFHEKKLYLLNKHEHYHHHNPYGPYGPPSYSPHSHPPHYPSHSHPHYPSHPPIHHPPSHHHPIPPSYNGPPVYSPHFTHYEPGFAKRNPYKVREPSPVNEDYYDDDDDNDGRYDDNNDYNNYNSHPGDINNYGFDRSANASLGKDQGSYANRYAYSRSFTLPSNHGANRGGKTIRFPDNRRKREVSVDEPRETIEERRGYFGGPQVQQCRQNQVCCRRPLTPQASNRGQCGVRHSQGINGRIKTPAYVDGESEFGEYPWQAAILKKDPKESVYVCGGTLIDSLHIITAAHCIKSHKGFELRVRVGEWDVNRDVEFYPYVERDVVSVHVHPMYYAGTLDNDLAILKMDHPVELTKYPHISPACLPDKYSDYAGQRCWTTGWGKDAFGDRGKYQNILKEVDVPIIGHGQCQQQLRGTRLGYNYELNPGFICAGGEEGKDACKGDGGGPLVCERGGTWQLVGVVSWGIGCGQVGVPGVYVNVAHYLDWIAQITGKFSPY